MRHRNTRSHSAIRLPQLCLQGIRKARTQSSSPQRRGGQDPLLPMGPYQGHVQGTWCCCAGPPTEDSLLTLMSPHGYESGGSSWHLPSHRQDHCCLWKTWAKSSLALPPALHGQRRSPSVLNSCQRSPLDLRAVLKPASPSRASPLPLNSPASNQAETLSR